MDHKSPAKIFFLMLIILLLGLACSIGTPIQSDNRSVPHEGRWGIYALNLSTEEVGLIYSSAWEITGLRLSPDGSRFAFSQKIDGENLDNDEICIAGVDGTNFLRLTQNDILDTYPAWSTDGTKIAFLSMRGATLDIYLMDTDGSNQRLLYDSGSHDGDVHWINDRIVFTRNSQIWMMNSDGTGAAQVTQPPRAGEWGQAVLPFGDYDPRFSPDGTKIVFERLLNDETSHGNYDIYTINSDGSGETALTHNGYTQGLPGWSYQGNQIVFAVSAIGNEGAYDIYLMNADGNNLRNVTPDYFPPNFLANSPIFSLDDSTIYFVGEWWEQ